MAQWGLRGPLPPPASHRIFLPPHQAWPDRAREGWVGGGPSLSPYTSHSGGYRVPGPKLAAAPTYIEFDEMCYL